MGGAAKAATNFVKNPVQEIKNAPKNVVQTAKTVGGQIADNKGLILGSMVGGPVGGLVGTAIVDKKNGLIGKPLAKGIEDLTTGLAPKVGLGSYKPDEGAFGQSATAVQMGKDSAQGQIDAAKRAAVSSPIVYNPATASMVNVAQLDPAQQAEFRARQVSLANQLTDQGNGIGPSLAQSQLQQGRDANIAAAMALAASQRGLTAGQGLRQVADQTTNANQLAAQEAARLRLTEQLAAREQLNSVLTGARGQDIDLATTNANYRQQGALADANNLTSISQANALNQMNADNMTAQNSLKQQAQNDSMVQAYMNQGLSLELAKMKAAQDLEALKSGNYNAAQQRTSGFLGGLGQAGATLGAAAIAASDKRLKKKIKDGDDDVIDLVENLGSHTYEYKDKKHGKGTYASPMAQDLEKSKIGKGMVIDTPEGKMVDYARGAGTYLAAAAMLHKRLKKVESSLARKG